MLLGSHGLLGLGHLLALDPLGFGPWESVKESGFFDPEVSESFLFNHL